MSFSRSTGAQQLSFSEHHANHGDGFCIFYSVNCFNMTQFFSLSSGDFIWRARWHCDAEK
jgi:hypothetical protein